MDPPDLMAGTDISRLPVAGRSNPFKIAAILSRSDILKERRNYLKKKFHYERIIDLHQFNKNTESNLDPSPPE
jgi:hypothetical protein